MISEPSEMRSRFQPIASITTATTPSTSGTDSRDDDARAPAEADAG